MNTIYINDQQTSTFTAIRECTAIPCINGGYSEEDRQKALLVMEQTDAEIKEGVIFGRYEIPRTLDDLKALWANVGASEYDTDWETLDTVQ